MPYRYPILLEVDDRLVVIVGGGAVGARKARTLVNCGAQRVRVVAPAFDAALPVEVERVAERYERRHLEGASLVFAATSDRSVNDAVMRDARQMGAWVNRADGATDAPGDFVVPARHQAGPVTLAVNAGSPTVSAWLRDRMAEQLEGRYLRLAEAVERLRRTIVTQAELEPSIRRQMLRELVSGEAIATLERDGEPGLARWLADRYPQWKSNLAG